MSNANVNAPVPAIEISGLKKYFPLTSGAFNAKKGSVKAVDDINLTINKGEIIGLAGESGSGKTTLARVILNLTPATEGQVLMNGQDISKLHGRELKAVRRSIATVFQDPASNLNPRLNVLSSIMRPMILHGVPKAEAVEKAQEAMKLVKMDERYLYSYPHQLSGGQLQRIAIARALLKDAPIVVLDEATAYADPENEQQIQKAFEGLVKGKTVIMIAHRLSTIQDADLILVMKQGELVESGTHKALVQQSGEYFKMWSNYTKTTKWHIGNEVKVC